MNKYLGYQTQVLEKLKAFWTAKEIEQQPDCWKLLSGIIAECQLEIDTFIAPILRQSNVRIILTGAGTSAFAGRALAPHLSELTGKRFEAIPTTDLVSNPSQYLAEDIPTLVVSFARSGNSPESVAAVALSSQELSECFHLVLTCNDEGELYQYAQNNEKSLAILMPEETNDKSFAMTSSFSSMMLAALLILANDKLMPSKLEQIASCTKTLIEEINDTVRELSQNDFGRVVYLGSGGFQGIAQESALKLLELTAGKVVACFDSPLAFRHGPKSIVNDNTLIVVYVSNNPYTRKYDLDLLSELRRDNTAGKVIAIAAQIDVQVTDGDYIHVPNMTSATDVELLFPYILFAQIYSFHRSLAMALTTDNPCLTGEVNRVVQGVTIYGKGKGK